MTIRNTDKYEKYLKLVDEFLDLKEKTMFPNDKIAVRITKTWNCLRSYANQDQIKRMNMLTAKCIRNNINKTHYKNSLLGIK